VKAIEERTAAIARVHARVERLRGRLPVEVGGDLVLYEGAPNHADRPGAQRTPGCDPLKNEARRRKPTATDGVLDRLRRGKKGAKFVALYDRGDWQGEGYESQSEAELALCNMIAAQCGGDPARIDALFRSSALMREKWDDSHFADGTTYGEATVRKAAELYEGAGGLEGNDDARELIIPDAFYLISLTHAGDRLMERHPHDLLWSHVGTRYRWPGTHWLEDRAAIAEQWADDVAMSYRLEADQFLAIARSVERDDADADLVAALEQQFPPDRWGDADEPWGVVVADYLRGRAKDLISFFKRLERPAGFAELLGRVAAYHTHPVEHLDAKPLLLACPNGTLDIRSGLLRPAERGDLITKVTAIDYIEGARSETWDRTLGEWTNGDAGVARYLQVAFGYSLLGNPVLGRFCFMLTGPGQSGRSAMLETLAAALGDYGSSFSWRAFEHKKGASHDEDLAALRGLRFVFSNEAGDRLLDTEKLKAVTSGEEQHVSRKHERSFQMRPSFVVWAATNKLPELPSDDLALWTRVRVIPFHRVFPLSSFRDKLAHDPEVLRAVLAWGVAGAREYLDHGLPACAAVDAATAEAQRELNPLSAWLDERAERVADAWSPVGDLFSDYTRWCERGAVAPHRRVGDRRFGTLLNALGFTSRPRNGVRGNLGIRLRRRASAV